MNNTFMIKTSRFSLQRGFTLIEVLLALILVALISAVIGPVLINVLKAQQQSYALLAPLADEDNCFMILQNDLLAAPRPNAAGALPCILSAEAIGGMAADTLSFMSASLNPLHPALLQREADAGQIGITWSVQAAANTLGLQWQRSTQRNILATDSSRQANSEIILDNLAYLDITLCSNGVYVENYNSDTASGVLPVAVKVRYARLNAQQQPGPEHIRIIHLDQVSLDPLQLAGGL